MLEHLPEILELNRTIRKSPVKIGPVGRERRGQGGVESELLGGDEIVPDVDQAVAENVKRGILSLSSRRQRQREQNRGRADRTEIGSFPWASSLG